MNTRTRSRYPLVGFAIAGLLVAAMFLLSGCDPANNAVFKQSTVSGGVVQQDSVQINGQLVAVTPEMRPLLDPSKIIKAGTAITENVVTVSPAATTVVNAIKYLPIPFADIASYALNGILGIGAIWLTKRGNTAQKVNKSLVQGVDTFRDILDQTEGGAKLDAHLTAALKQQQEREGVQAIVKLLVDRFATPEKPHHEQLTSAALKS